MTTRRRFLQRCFEYWWVPPVVGTLGTFSYMIWYATRVTFGKNKASTPQFQAGQNHLIGPVSGFHDVWASHHFRYDNRDCIVIRVPQAVEGGIQVLGMHFVAYSRVCTHLGCLVNMVHDQEVLAFAFNYRPPPNQTHPQLGCHCHYSVFDPLAAGNAVFGKALLPLPRVQLIEKNKQLYAVGIEPAVIG